MKGSGCPLTVSEARAILIADNALDATFEARQEAGLLFCIETAVAWIQLVTSANDRIAAWERGEGETKGTIISLLAYREGSSWIVQAIEEDVTSQGEALLDVITDLGRIFDTRDHLHAADPSLKPRPRAPAAYTSAFTAGHRIGNLPLGRARFARVSLGISPFKREVAS